MPKQLDETKEEEDEEPEMIVIDSCHGRVIRNQQNLFPIFLLLP